jgi:hypothetical protein
VVGDGGDGVDELAAPFGGEPAQRKGRRVIHQAVAELDGQPNAGVEPDRGGDQRQHSVRHHPHGARQQPRRRGGKVRFGAQQRAQDGDEHAEQQALEHCENPGQQPQPPQQRRIGPEPVDAADHRTSWVSISWACHIRA